MTNIGFQNMAFLPIVKRARHFEKQRLKHKNVRQWVPEFPGIPQLLEGLNVGSVVFGEAGEAPPLLRKVANSNLGFISATNPFSHAKR